MELLKTGAYLVNGTEIIEDTPEAKARLQAVAGPDAPSKEEAAKGTIAYGILEAHNTSDNMEKLKIRFDKLTSHDITYVGIIQTARASGLEKFPMFSQTVITAYVLLVEQSTKMTICLDLPVRKSTVESMYLLIRQLSISSQEKCWQAAER